MAKNKLNNQLTEYGIISIVNDAPEYYIFKSLTGDIGFVQIETEMDQLNNYCWLVSQGVEKKVGNLNNQIKKAIDEPNRVIGKVADIEITNSDTTSGLEEYELPLWKDTQDFIMPATCVLLLYIFVEKSLKHLCSYLDGLVKETNSGPKKKSDQSKVQTYLDYIKDEFFPELEVDSHVWVLLKKAQTIRNSYAHGDWDSVRKEIATVNLVNAFTITTNLFYSIEKQYDSWEKSKVII